MRFKLNPGHIEFKSTVQVTQPRIHWLVKYIVTLPIAVNGVLRKDEEEGQRRSHGLNHSWILAFVETFRGEERSGHGEVAQFPCDRLNRLHLLLVEKPAPPFGVRFLGV